MKVSVLGAGAIGSMLGGLLKHDAPDIDVTLIVRGDHGKAVCEQGAIVLHGPWGVRNVPIQSSLDPAAVAGSDYVFVTVKSQATEEAAKAAAPHWGNAKVISVQNGINDEVLGRYVDSNRLVMGMTAMNVAIDKPGSASLQLGGSTIFGPSTNQHGDKLPQEAVQLLSRIHSPGLRFHYHPNVVGMRYNKLAVNAIGFASCLSASNFIVEALGHSRWRDVIGLPIVQECRQVFDKAGIVLARIPGVPSVAQLHRLMSLMSMPLLGPTISLGARRLFNRKPIVFSLQQDLQRGKQTEVDHVNGEVVRLAESLGMVAPINAKVVELVHELEQRDDRSFFTREEVIGRFETVKTDHMAA